MATTRASRNRNAGGDGRAVAPPLGTAAETRHATGAAIREVSFTLLRDPFAERHADHMPRLSGDWSLIELCRVTLESGVVGVGETIIQYTWGRVPPGAAERVGGVPSHVRSVLNGRRCLARREARAAGTKRVAGIEPA